MKVLAIDVGGTNIKFLATGRREIRKFPSGPKMDAEQMVEGVVRETSDWEYEVITIGYPGPVVQGKLVLEPRNLAPGWVDYDYEAKFAKPVKLINDAAMQALGSYERGRMLFLGLGTGMGSALIADGVVAALELAHLPYKKGRTFEDYVGLRGLERLGRKKWQRAVEDVVVKTIPPGARLGDNRNAFRGGFRLWEDQKTG